MKCKMLRIVIALVMAFCLAGCGHKSSAELTDIEQFKCQDSIQTVFDVLGESEILQSMVGDGQYYKYENLNLWGYEGNAVFDVRDDKDTIQNFYCNLTLENWEFEELISQFTEKYGSYEVDNYGETIKVYGWDIAEEEAEELGYNDVHIQDNGDKKYTVYFSDEWSMLKDEAYYEYLEEKNTSKTLAEKTYSIGEDKFSFSFSESNGEYSFHLLCNIQDKVNAFYTQILLNEFVTSEEESLQPLSEIFSYSIFVGDGTSIHHSPDAGTFIMSSDEDALFVSADEYFSAEWLVEEADKLEESSSYGEQVVNFMADFLESNG